MNSKIGKNKNKNKVDPILKFRFGMKARLEIYEKLKSYTEEGFPIYDSLLKFKERFKNQKSYKEKVVAEWMDKIKNGASFSKAIEGWAPEAEINLIAAGEAGKGIDVGLGEAMKFAKSSQEIISVIKGGAAYPVVLLVVVFAFIAMFSIQSAPTYLKILPLERWPDTAQYLYTLSVFIVSNWLKIVILMAITGIVINYTIASWIGSVRDVFDKFPPWSIYKIYQSSSFLIALASMMQSGTPLNDSLIKIKNTSSPWLRKYLNEMIENMKKGGRNFGQHLNVGLLDKETAYDVIDYSELGKFEDAIYTMGEKNLKTSVAQIESRMGLIKQVMIVLMGLTVMAIYSTSMELNSSVADAAATQKGR